MPRKKPWPLLGLLVAAALLIAALASGAQAQEGEFSFVVFGDTRSESYLPSGQGQAEQMQRFLRQRYSQPPELFFDPLSGELQRMVVRNGGQDPTTFFYRDGWPWLATRGGKVIMRKEGRAWVYRRVAGLLNDEALQPGSGASFALHTGDFILWGAQGQDRRHNPDWQDLHDNFLSALPPPDSALGLPGRIFPALGNHEVWKDEEIKGLLSTLPHLRQMGLDEKRRIYSFDFRGRRFIFLDSGAYKGQGEGWFADQPDFAGQMAALTNWLQEAKDQGMKQVFVTYHKPSFSISGHGPLPEGHNPHPYLKPFAQDLDITVFNGHVHTTEMYQKDGIRYLMLGAGGAPQVLEAKSPPPDYPKELYWKGQPRAEEYNYLLVKAGPQGTSFFLHRFRPSDVEKPLLWQEIMK